MIIVETKLKGAFLIELERLEDERGFFARAWCRREFEEYGLNPNLVQFSISFNRKKGTLRGMHYQAPPFEEDKLIRCTMGAIYDVIIDLRSGSETFMKWFAAELSAENRKMIYVPKGFAHGFQTLIDNTEVFYQTSEFHVPEAASGVRWNDPKFNIIWPINNPTMSLRDKNFEDFAQEDLLKQSEIMLRKHSYK